MLAYPANLWLINRPHAANGYGTEMSPQNHGVPIVESQHHVIDPANPRRALHDGVENRLHVRGRAADDTEHLGGCRLMFQSFAQFCIALFELAIARLKLLGDALELFLSWRRSTTPGPLL